METSEKTRIRHEQLLADHIDDMRQDFWDVAEHCGSPIEVALMAELQWMEIEYGSNLHRIEHPMNVGLLDNAWRWIASTKVAIFPQAKWQNYRIDFGVLSAGPNGGRLKLAIECDGHDFHEKTKMQAARDKSRDRDLTLGGWIPFHFTGSEIYKDAKGCAAQIADYINTWLFSEIQGYYDRVPPK